MFPTRNWRTQATLAKAGIFLVAILLFPMPSIAQELSEQGSYWWAKYQTLGEHDPKWDTHVLEGIRTWNDDSLGASVASLKKALDLGCDCPIVKFIYARNRHVLEGPNPEIRKYLQESIAGASRDESLAFIRFYSTNILGWQHLRTAEYSKAQNLFETALAIENDGIDSSTREDAQNGLDKAKAQVMLSTIELPTNADKEQVRSYVRQILRISAGRSGSARYDDKEVELLMKVGPGNLDVLLETWGAAGTENRREDYYMKNVLGRLARAQDKPLLLKWLPFHTEVVQIMTDKGWVQDMRPFLLERMAEHSEDADFAVLRATAALRDPATYADLVWHFENASSGIIIYDNIKDLPGIELKDAVLRTWEASKSWTGWRATRRCNVAATAMDYGVLDALRFAIEQLEASTASEWQLRTLRQGIYEHTSLHGTDEEARAWYEANKDKITFDEKSRMFGIAR